MVNPIKRGKVHGQSDKAIVFLLTPVLCAAPAGHRFLHHGTFFAQSIASLATAAVPPSTQPRGPPIDRSPTYSAAVYDMRRQL
jgi:hypothetical protein